MQGPRRKLLSQIVCRYGIIWGVAVGLCLTGYRSVHASPVCCCVCLTSLRVSATHSCYTNLPFASEFSKQVTDSLTYQPQQDPFGRMLAPMSAPMSASSLKEVLVA